MSFSGTPSEQLWVIKHNILPGYAFHNILIYIARAVVKEDREWRHLVHLSTGPEKHALVQRCSSDPYAMTRLQKWDISSGNCTWAEMLQMSGYKESKYGLGVTYIFMTLRLQMLDKNIDKQNYKIDLEIDFWP